MREKELRIALVCFGGVSLAIYMHGISKEILKLVRASRALHAITDRMQRAQAAFFDDADELDPEHDTEAIYFELLREIGRTIELRVVVDIIAGASAGGINGAMLARALSHDLPMGALRELWLDNGDVAVLLSADARAKRWSKWFMKPLLWGAQRAGMLGGAADEEVREKISLFVRSRWFKPPLDGHVMATLMYDAATALGAPRNSIASLLPSGQSLDLFVAVTDYYGYHQLLQLHDPPLVHELEHHHVLRFSYRRQSSGEVVSDFGLDNAPALAFAARATSSFPGAFPPARIVEMDSVVAARGGRWPRRADFIARNFHLHLQAGVDPTVASFIDGGVVNNRPFHEAIAAIRGRPAYRQVDRRLVYIDPDPAPRTAPRHRNIPGFFATLRGALSDIPSSQPVTDELNWVVEFNGQVRRLQAIIESARPQVSELVASVIPAALDQPVVAHELRAWREQVNARVARDAGFAYEAYVRLKLTSVRDFVARTIVQLRGMPLHSPLTRVVEEIVDVWGQRRGIVYSRAATATLEAETPSVEALPGWAKFLLAFDVGYRERRLHFLIEGQNRLYQLLDRDEMSGLDPRVVDRLKREFYARRDALRRFERAEAFSKETRRLVETIFPVEPSADEVSDIKEFADGFVARHGGQIDRLVDLLAEEIDLNATTRDLDELLATLSPAQWLPAARREVLVNYLGFPFWDVLTFPMMNTRQIGELNEILLDRISPQDARALKGFDGPEALKGVGFGHFAAFLSRAYRENDYLLGRLHALDRLIDIVCDSAGADAMRGFDVLGLKRRGFTQILDVEAPHLVASTDLIAALRACVAGMSKKSEACTL
jgi:patatin-related protein